MGKSPGKWIKTLLFGKKSSKSTVQKRRASNVGNTGKEPASGINSGANTEQVSHVTNVNGKNPKIQRDAPSDLHSVGEAPPSKQTDSIEKTSAAVSSPVDSQRSVEELAAIKAQAAFRGYLARRAFNALKGIIRLQALVRGHLARRQALATLHCTWGIVKLQSLFRGIRARKNVNFDVIKSSHHAKVDLANKGVVSCNAFARKLLSSSISSTPLGFQYAAEEPNSTWRWLDRWTSSVFWKPPQQPKKIADAKPQARRYAMETESGRSKRNSGKNLGANIRKISSYPLEIPAENPQSELERVKRSLRKVSSSTAEVPTARADPEVEKPKRSVYAPENGSEVIVKKDSPDPKISADEESTPVHANGDLSAEEELSEENLKTSKRRASFSAAKPEYPENGLQSTPKLPSYMAATESARAKLRAQNSPRVWSEEADKTGFTRRYSLPSSTNGRVNSASPRTQRPVVAGGKGGLGNERSIPSSREDKPMQVEWRR